MSFNYADTNFMSQKSFGLWRNGWRFWIPPWVSLWLNPMPPSPNLQKPRIPWMFLWFRKKHVSIPYQAMVSGGCLSMNGGEGGGYCMLLWGVSLSTLWQVHAYGIANLASTSAVGFPWLRVKQSSTASLMRMECFKFCWGLIHLY